MENSNKKRKFFFYLKIIKFIIIVFLLLLFTLEFIIIYKNNRIFKEPKKIIADEITLVTAFYKIKSKHSYNEYIEWMNNILKINRSMVFFMENSMSQIIKNMRPNEFENKTIWIEYNIKDFYSYKHYLKEFKETYKIDMEKSYHTILLYLVWAEKCKFLENAIIKNYFNSTCFYWIDAGYFRNKTKSINYINDWPSSKNCLEDPRVIFNVLRASSKSEVEELKNFNINTHIEFQKKVNICGNMFGGQSKYIKRFVYLYYNTLELFVKNKIFIGKDQNIFAFISYLYPNISKLVFSDNWFYLQDYLS